ncbi:MAG: hypothetical protein JJV98_07350 [Desulfosarcina sp.]|nr:hypothetical protein [Desulfobacterales bacterium]
MAPEMTKHTIRMRDDTRSQITVFRGDHSSPVVICMPAMGVRAAFYEPLALNLGRCGPIAARIRQWVDGEVVNLSR